MILEKLRFFALILDQHAAQSPKSASFLSADTRILLLRAWQDLGIAEDEFLVVDKAQEADDLLYDLGE